MTIIQSIVLGIIQGLTEFLPISSSGHLILVPSLLGWQLQDLSFDVALHMGTALAVLVYFKKDWLNMAQSSLKDGLDFVSIKKFDTKKLRRETKMLFTILIVSIPVGIVGLLFQSDVEALFRSPISVAIMLILVSFVMFFADKISEQSRTEITFFDALIISLSQILALIPGTSRSGITISTGLFRNIRRHQAARFSFLLATPLILGSGIAKLSELLTLDAASLNTILIGFLTSFITGLITVKLLLKFLQKKGLGVFIIYRIILGIIILLLYV